MKVILAISGGIDSMVMLDVMGSYWRKAVIDQWEELEKFGTARARIVAATYDHGTRPSAEDDVRFVQRVCMEDFDLACFAGQDELGEKVAEEVARGHRYEFLREIAKQLDDPKRFMSRNPYQKKPKSPPMIPGPTVIYTAHHLDDLVETVAINLLRGTGWRGLAVLDAPDVRRPFLEAELMPEPLRGLVPFDKKTILEYAARFGVHFRQDPTNNEDNYLRNRVREKLKDFDKKQEIYDLWQKQKKLKAEIDEIVAELLPGSGEAWQRKWFEDLDEKVALEILRAGTLRAGISATRPQLENFRQAILTYAPGKSFNLPGDKLVKFTKSEFYLE